MDLVNLTAKSGPIDMVAVDFPCQPISRAGPRRGQRDARFSLFLDLCRIINWCQTEQRGRSLIYLLENVCIDADADKAVLDADKLIRAFLGEPSICIDAPQLGSLSHGWRRFWTNMLAPDELASLLPKDHPLPMPEVYLDDEHSLAPVFSLDQPPFRPCNVKGQDKKVLPTIVS